MRGLASGFGATLVVILGAGTAFGQANPDHLVAEASAVELRIDGEVQSGGWRLSKELNPDIYGLAVEPGQSKNVCFVSGANSLCRSVSLGAQHDFIISYDGFDYPTRVVAIPPAAVFDAAYQAENRGKTSILVPEVYELINIAIALTPKAMESRYLVYKNSPYYQDVIGHFGAYADDPLVAKIEAAMKADNFAYFTIKMNGYAFEFDADDRIQQSRIYDRTGFDGSPDNTLRPYLAELQAFADRSHFRSFYRAHQQVYDEQIAYFRDHVDVAGSLDWLVANFPAVKPYDTNKIVFSPLVNSNQSLTTIESNGFRELQPHVNFPYDHESYAGLSARDAALQKGMILFTEMNHGFINPTAVPLAADIAPVFGNRDVWAEAGKSTDSYGGPQELFNEYMNWALISLYFYDKADPADRERMTSDVEEIMVDGRGFKAFKPFNRALLHLYASRPAGTTLADLYPAIIAWSATYKNAPGQAISAH